MLASEPVSEAVADVLLIDGDGDDTTTTAPPSAGDGDAVSVGDGDADDDTEPDDECLWSRESCACACAGAPVRLGLGSVEELADDAGVEPGRRDGGRARRPNATTCGSVWNSALLHFSPSCSAPTNGEAEYE